MREKERKRGEKEHVSLMESSRKFTRNYYVHHYLKFLEHTGAVGSQANPYHQPYLLFLVVIYIFGYGYIFFSTRLSLLSLLVGMEMLY